MPIQIMHVSYQSRLLMTVAMVACIGGAAFAADRGPDFDGDGFDDLPVGIPLENISDQIDAGAMEVIYGTANGLRSGGDQFFSQNSSSVPDTAESGDRFGAAFAWGDFDGDGFDDLAIGAPLENIGNIADAGAVTVLYGSPDGLTGSGSQVWTQNSTGIFDASENGDQFGWSLAAGNFDGDEFIDLAIGVPGEVVNGAQRAGAVNVLYGSPSGLQTFENQFWSQDTSSIADLAEVGDRFGSAMAVGDFDGDGIGDLAIGVPGESFAFSTNAGAVTVLYGQHGVGLSNFADQFFFEDSSGVPDIVGRDDLFGSCLAVGDFDGDDIDDLAIGVPGEDIDGAFQDEGAVIVLYGRLSGLGATGSQFFSQDQSVIPGISQPDDHFGAELAAGDFDRDGFDDLAAGAPNDSVGSVQACGTVIVIYGRDTGLNGSDSQLWSQNTSGIVDQCEGGDRFGAALLTADFNGDQRADLAVGVPLESVNGVLGAGAVSVIYGSTAGLTATGDQLWTQDSSGISDTAETGDNFGSSLGAAQVLVLP